MNFKTLLSPLGICLLGAIFCTLAWGMDKPPVEHTVNQDTAVISQLIRQLLIKKTDLSINTGLDEHNTVRAAAAGQTELKTAAPETPRPKRPAPPAIIAEGVIVRFKSSAIQALARANRPPPEEVIARLEAALGKRLIFHGAMVGAAHVFRFVAPMTGEALAPRLQRAESLPGVEWIEADTRVKAHLVPNDWLFNRQWNLQGTDKGITEGIGAIRAWDITRGSPNTIVAMLDTGVGPHPEFAARLLPGYDFVSDPENANDGDGPDSDASDPGNWRLEGECGNAPARNSSWHGTFVTGIVAAQGNNLIGIAGVNWNTRILPVRVLGKCGGVDSDILNAMAWAAGLPVPGVPTNPHPARIINLSLAGFSPFGCPQPYQDIIQQISGQGVLIVVAAGNESGNTRNYSPANCRSVLPVMATGYDGDLAPYSNWSLAANGIAAPGGSAQHRILSTFVAGTTTPQGFTYAAGYGTSMAAAQVSGIASLALAVNPYLSGRELSALLRLTSRPFPPGTQCANEGICGAGIASASNTVQAADTLSQYRLVYEFYNARLNHYFLTASRKEAAMINRNNAKSGWRNAGHYFYAWSRPEEGLLPVCRFYTQGANSHFYTAKPEECALLRSLNPKNVLAEDKWTYEGIAFYAKLPVDNACPSMSAPVYRVYNNRWMHNDSNHRFVSSLKDYKAMTAQGWLGEGIAFCVVATPQDFSNSPSSP